jgi:hypothetical protein
MVCGDDEFMYKFMYEINWRTVLTENETAEKKAAEEELKVVAEAAEELKAVVKIQTIWRMREAKKKAGEADKAEAKRKADEARKAAEDERNRNSMFL